MCIIIVFQLICLSQKRKDKCLLRCHWVLSFREVLCSEYGIRVELLSAFPFWVFWPTEWLMTNVLANMRTAIWPSHWPQHATRLSNSHEALKCRRISVSIFSLPFEFTKCWIFRMWTQIPLCPLPLPFPISIPNWYHCLVALRPMHDYAWVKRGVKGNWGGFLLFLVGRT